MAKKTDGWKLLLMIGLFLTFLGSLGVYSSSRDGQRMKELLARGERVQAEVTGKQTRRSGSHTRRGRRGSSRSYSLSYKIGQVQGADPVRASKEFYESAIVGNSYELILSGESGMRPVFSADVRYIARFERTLPLVAGLLAIGLGLSATAIVLWRKTKRHSSLPDLPQT